MENSDQNDAERRELRVLVERIKRGGCVLVLGPYVAVRASDPQRRPLDELLAAELLSALGPSAAVTSQAPASLRRAADMYYGVRQDRDDLELLVQDFYAREAKSATDFHRDLARLPFKLCLGASPDKLMLTAFREAGKTPQQGYYGFKRANDARLSEPTAQSPLIYYLFGYYEDPRSLVLTESDLIEYLVCIVKGNPSMPDQVRSVLADPSSSFLFIGFGFQNWYLRVLLQVMNIYGHQSKAIALEDTNFFSHPDHAQTVGFFSGNRLVDFRPLRWELFARQLRQTYEAGIAQEAPAVSAAQAPLPPTAPKAFISFANEDRPVIEAFAGKLKAQGVRIWLDQQDFRAGDKWEQVLHDVIEKRVDYVVVVQTAQMNTALKGVWREEIEVALVQQSRMNEFDGQQLRFIIPVKMGDCVPLSALKDLQSVDVSTDDGVKMVAASILEDWGRRASLRPRLPGQV